MGERLLTNKGINAITAGLKMGAGTTIAGLSLGTIYYAEPILTSFGLMAGFYAITDGINQYYNGHINDEPQANSGYEAKNPQAVEVPK